MKSLLVLLCLASTAFALTPKERELVTGLSRINMELRANNASQEAQIERDATDALFASQKIDSLSARLAESKKLEGDQEFELGIQQQKIKAVEDDRDRQAKRADAAEAKEKAKALEAHRNATERDICLFIAAVFGTVLLMTYSGYIIGWIVKIFPQAAPFGIGLEIGIAVVFFGAIYGAGRGFLALVYSRL